MNNITEKVFFSQEPKKFIDVYDFLIRAMFHGLSDWEIDMQKQNIQTSLDNYSVTEKEWLSVLKGYAYAVYGIEYNNLLDLAYFTDDYTLVNELIGNMQQQDSKFAYKFLQALLVSQESRSC